MPLLPKGSVLTFTIAASSLSASIVIEGDLGYSPVTQDFTRKEYSNAYLMNLPEDDGSEPVWLTNVAGGKIQVDYNCGSSSGPRNPSTDDNNLDSIMKKFTIDRYTIKGGPSSPSAIDNLYNVAKDHARRLAVFDSYVKRFEQKLSYGYIYGLRNETFSYLTTTGLNVTGTALTKTNCLIRSFNAGVTHENPTAGTIVAKDWSITLDVITSIDSQLVY